MKNFIKYISIFCAIIIAASMFTGCDVIQYIFGKGTIPSSTDNPDGDTDVVTDSVLYTDINTDAITKLASYKDQTIDEDLTVTELDILNEYYGYIDQIYAIDETTEIVDDGNITQKDIDAKLALKPLLETSGTVAVNDFLIIDYKGTLDGEALDECTATDSSILVGQKKYLTDFENSVVGKNIGDTYDVNVAFPEDYNEKLGGKTVVFTITIKLRYPALSETTLKLLKDFGATEYTSVEAYKESVKNTLVDEMKESFDQNFLSNILYKIYTESEFGTLPEDDVNELKESLEASAAYYNINLLTYCYYMYGITTEDQITEYINYQVSIKLLIAKILKEENIEISDEEYQTGLQMYADQYGYETKEALEAAAGKNTIKNELLITKLESFFKNNWTINVVE